MELATVLLLLTIISIFAFDFTKGFCDAADMVTTAIASRVMKSATAIAS
jgi:PiT family inorganic phosphate transporter